jgi:large subunit ribosomal protein L22
MAAAIARAKYVRIAPRKMRLVADMIRGKRVAEAKTILQFAIKRSAPIINKVLDSAVANAENAARERRERIDTDEMVIGRILIDPGPSSKRYRSQPRGRATKVRKRTSHVTLFITDKAEK